MRRTDKQYGLNYGNTNIGVYKLGNGATAYIASTNSTSLIIQLKTGEYVIVGNSNTDALARSFSENVTNLNATQNPAVTGSEGFINSREQHGGIAAAKQHKTNLHFALRCA